MPAPLFKGRSGVVDGQIDEIETPLFGMLVNVLWDKVCREQLQQ